MDDNVVVIVLKVLLLDLSKYLIGCPLLIGEGGLQIIGEVHPLLYIYQLLSADQKLV